MLTYADVCRCVLSVMRAQSGHPQLLALKILFHFTTDTAVHGHLLQFGSAEPLIECLEV
jgi:hypothetical protein